jgi:hypothetical protein
MEKSQADNAKIEFDEKAHNLKKSQGKTKQKYDFLKQISPKYFQAEFVKAQAEEICRYIKEIQLTPLNPWYSKLYDIAQDGQFMSQFYLTFNEFGVVEPDYEKINTLILPDPKPEDFPRPKTIL